MEAIPWRGLSKTWWASDGPRVEATQEINERCGRGTQSMNNESRKKRKTHTMNNINFIEKSPNKIKEKNWTFYDLTHTVQSEYVVLLLLIMLPLVGNGQKPIIHNFAQQRPWQYGKFNENVLVLVCRNGRCQWNTITMRRCILLCEKRMLWTKTGTFRNTESENTKFDRRCAREESERAEEKNTQVIQPVNLHRIM